MLEYVDAFHKALNIKSTWQFVLIVAIGFGLLAAIAGGALAWIVDMRYKNSPEYKAEHPDPKTQAVVATSAQTTTANRQQETNPQAPQSNPVMAQTERPTTRKKTKSPIAKGGASTSPPTQSAPVAAAPPVATQAPPTQAQECTPGANCAQSSGQTGGITAGQLNIGTPPPSVVQLVCVYKNRAHTYVLQESLTKRTPIQGFESQYRVHITGQQVPQVDVRVTSASFIHVDCDSLVDGELGRGTTANNAAACTFRNLYEDIGQFTIFADKELPFVDESFLAYRCKGVPCNAIKPLPCE